MQDALKHEEQQKQRRETLTRNIGYGVIGLMALLLIFGIVNELVNPPDNPFGPQQSFLILATLAFLGGVLSFLSPCTLPILPAYFAFASQSSRGQIATNTTVFMLGVATVFSLFGASASSLGKVLRQNQDLILLIGGALIVVFGVMSLLGKGFTGMSQSDDDQNVEVNSLGGTFVFGMTFAAGWSSCIGPILGIMLTVAATTGSVLRGTILLFIFAMGLGLPLIIVSTFIGRMSRQSLIWRILRGRGRFFDTPRLIISLIWSLAVWQILLALTGYAFDNVVALDGQVVTAVHTYGILVLALAGAFLWTFYKGQEKVQLHLHTTSLFSGVLFLAMGVFMLSGQLTLITAWANELTANSEWFAELEEGLFNLFQ